MSQTDVNAAWEQGYAAGNLNMGTSACCWLEILSHLLGSPRSEAWFAGYKAGMEAQNMLREMRKHLDERDMA